MSDQQGLGDILANAVTHGLGAVLAVAGAAELIVASAHGNAWKIVSCSIFGATLILVYVCSTLYHSLIRTRARHLLRILDHSSIYLLIAGTYTPFTLVCLRGRVGWALLAAVWTLAVAGVVFKSIAVDRYQILSAVVYIGMGWLVIFATGPLVRAVTWHGAAWLLAGGLCYTGGVFFFALDRVPFFHGIWHLFVLAGSAFHYFAVWFYVLPHAA
ncbi:MAG TPA: hemolysin III family protein [Acidisarcina sp.]|nr:hemolysin III family protein [Acidisarcina sp.]